MSASVTASSPTSSAAPLGAGQHAFALAGDGSLGAVQAGVLAELSDAGQQGRTLADGLIAAGTSIARLDAGGLTSWEFPQQFVAHSH
jgi:predicted acylesterase/phospholipase RssA